MQRRTTLFAMAAMAMALGTGTAAGQGDKPIRIGMTVSSAGTFALQAQSLPAHATLMECSPDPETRFQTLTHTADTSLQVCTSAHGQRPVG